MLPQRTRLYDGFVKVERDDTSGHEVVVATDSVAVFIFDQIGEQVVFISQCREPMIRGDNLTGEITEVVAGRFDKEIGVSALVVKEIKEEVGLTISEDDVQLLNNGVPLALSPGILTERTYLALVEVEFCNDELVDTETVFGAADESERITRKIVPLSELPSMLHDNMKTWALTQYFLNLLWSRGQHPNQTDARESFGGSQ